MLLSYDSKLWLVYWTIFFLSKLRNWWSVSKGLAFHTEVFRFEAILTAMQMSFLLPYNSPVTSSNLCYYRIACSGSKPWSASDIKLKVCSTWYLLSLHCHPQWQHSNSTHWEPTVFALVTHTETKVVKIHTHIYIIFFPHVNHICVPY